MGGSITTPAENFPPTSAGEIYQEDVYLYGTYRIPLPRTAQAVLYLKDDGSIGKVWHR